MKQECDPQIQCTEANYHTCISQRCVSGRFLYNCEFNVCLRGFFLPFVPAEKLTSVSFYRHDVLLVTQTTVTKH